MPIRVLPREVIERIAAGEVVERPASVIKELVENALDAQATSVQVGVATDPVESLEVVDNGTGMGAEEIPLALERHATSKIVSETDLQTIATLGFRGEALASIAAVSDFMIETRTRDTPFGVRVRVEAGVQKSVQEVGVPQGTRIQVRNLFRSTPARLKFLRTRQTEMGQILDTFVRLALSRCEVSFQLRRGGKPWLNAPVTGDLRQRAAQVLGWEFAEGLARVTGESGSYRIDGLVGRVDQSNATSRGMFLFVNNRPIRDAKVQRIVRDCYQGFLPRERFPACLLFLTVPSDEVDVNVHPTKMEVHFAQLQVVRELLQKELGHVLTRLPLDQGFGAPERHHAPARHDATSQVPGGGRIEPLQPYVRGDVSPSREQPVTGVAESAAVSGGMPEKVPVEPRTFQDIASAAEVEDEDEDEDEVPREGTKPHLPEPMFSEFRVIGQFRDTYLVCEYRDHLVLIDQHAAHERIAYERLEEQYAREGIARQGFLVPEVVDLAPREAECLKDRLSELLTWGLEVEFYGGSSFVVKALPAVLTGADPKQLLVDIAQELVSLERARRLDDLRDQVFARMACHSVVRAGQSLAVSEMESLLETMDEKPGLTHCPHGRPVMISWPVRDIQKRFHRG